MLQRLRLADIPLDAMAAHGRDADAPRPDAFAVLIGLTHKPLMRGEFNRHVSVDTHARSPIHFSNGKCYRGSRSNHEVEMGKLDDMTGRIFGRLTVTDRASTPRGETRAY